MRKEVQEYILELLKLISEKFNNEMHNPRNPSFQLGNDGRLWLWIPIGDIFQSIIFDENYENITPKECFDSIVKDLGEAGYNV